MDRTALSVTSLTDESGDREFWLSKTPEALDLCMAKLSEERLATMELLRAVNSGYDPLSARLQRVLSVAQLGEN